MRRGSEQRQKGSASVSEEAAPRPRPSRAASVSHVGLVLNPSLCKKRNFFLHKRTPQNKYLIAEVDDGWLRRKPLLTLGMF